MVHVKLLVVFPSDGLHVKLTGASAALAIHVLYGSLGFFSKMS